MIFFKLLFFLKCGLKMCFFLDWEFNMWVWEVGGGDEVGKLSGDGWGESGGLRVEYGCVIGDVLYVVINIGFLVFFKLLFILVCVGICFCLGFCGCSVNVVMEMIFDLCFWVVCGYDG